MSRALRKRAGARIFSASSSPIRLEILRLLQLSGPLSYSEIMQRMGLDPEKQTGRFAYHLRSVQRARLVQADKKTRKYRLTEIGVKLADFAQELDEYALKRAGKLLVRTSRLAIEEFDRGKIVESLVKEAGMPRDLAERVGRETEDRLLMLEVKYLTAPLIREIVNAVLIEKGLEEYRHRMTRLGLPVHDVTEVIQAKGGAGLNSESVRLDAADSVLREYVLLNVLPREVADAHLSGRIHIEDLGTFILKPHCAQVYLPQLLEDGTNRLAREMNAVPLQPRRSLRSTVQRFSKALGAFRAEVSAGQCVDMFNVWLAPYAHGVSDEEVEEALREFVTDLARLEAGPNPAAGIAVGLELEIPRAVADRKVGRGLWTYSEYGSDALRVATALLRVLSREPSGAPLFNPVPVLKIRSKGRDSSWDEAFQLAHRVGSKTGTTLIANLTGTQGNRIYSSDGASFPSTGDEDYGRPYIGTVVVNLPRIACLSGGEESVFQSELKSSLDVALDALEVRHRALYERIRGNLLPYLFEGDGEAPCRFEEAVMAVGFVGLDEATALQTGEHIYEGRSSSSFAERCLESMAQLVSERGEQTGERLFLTQITSGESAERLALLDYEEHGQVATKARPGTRTLYYTNVTILPLEAEVPLRDRLRIEGALNSYSSGGHLALIEIDQDVGEEVMMEATAKIVEKYEVGLHAYSRYVTRCERCQVNVVGLAVKCPSCGGSAHLMSYGRASTRYLPLRYWTQSRLANARARRRYSPKELFEL